MSSKIYLVKTGMSTTKKELIAALQKAIEEVLLNTYEHHQSSLAIQTEPGKVTIYYTDIVEVQ